MELEALLVISILIEVIGLFLTTLYVSRSWRTWVGDDQRQLLLTSWLN
jgi:hypothetical protein